MYLVCFIHTYHMKLLEDFIVTVIQENESSE
jgi:hypothetical protein